MTRRRVSSTSDQGLEAMVEMLRQVGDRHVFDVSRGELKRQRQAVEPRADISGDGNCVAVTRKMRRVRLCALEEQFDCGRWRTASGVTAHGKG
jgi:hypothetical protein